MEGCTDLHLFGRAGKTVAPTTTGAIKNADRDSVTSALHGFLGTPMKTSTKLPLPSKQYMRDSRWMGRHYRELSLKYLNK